MLSSGFPNSPVMEPGWSPSPSDPQPYFQVDFLEPTWVSGVVTQASGPKLGYLTKYRLASALQSGAFTDYTEDGKPGSAAQVWARLRYGRGSGTGTAQVRARLRYGRGSGSFSLFIG